MTGVRGVRPSGEYRFVGASLYDVHLDHSDVPEGTAVKPSLTLNLGGYSIDDEGHNFTAVMRLTVESALSEQDTHVVKLEVGVLGYWISSEPLTSPIDGEEAVDRLFPYAKAYVEQFLGQAQLNLPPIPDVADVPFSDADEPRGTAATDESVVAADESPIGAQ